MIRFLYRAGSDDTVAALQKDIGARIEHGENAILIVPEQATVSTERRMLEVFSPTAQLYFEVSNFTRLANRIFRTVGGLSYHYATASVRALSMWRTLREESGGLLQYSKDAATDIRLTDKILSAVAQFKAYRVSPDALLDASDALEKEDPLKAKLFDLGVLYAAFQKRIGKHYQDASDDLTRAANLLETHPALLRDTHIYIDSFTDFTGEELHLVRLLMRRVPTLTVTFLQDGPGAVGIHLASPAATHQRLLRMAAEEGIEISYEKKKKTAYSSAISYLSDKLFDMTAEPLPLALCEKGEVALSVSPNPFAEAEYAAATVQKLVRSGCRYKDIAVILRDATAWSGIIDAAFEKEGIPCYLSEKTDITLRPLMKLILLSLRIKLYRFQGDDVISYLKTGLTGIPADNINFFEEYVGVWHLRGKGFLSPFTMNPDGYSERRSPRGDRILEMAEETRKCAIPPLLTFFEALDEASTIAEQCRALYRFLLALSVPETLKTRASEALSRGERKEAEELAKLFRITITTLEEIAQTVGDETADTEKFTDALRLAFAKTDIGTIPTSADEVTIGSASTLRADKPRFALVLGLTEGEFPRTVKDDGLLSDADKLRLLDFGIELSAGNANAASDEFLYVCRAFSTPSEKLFLSYSKAGTDGGFTAPSIAISRVKTLFPAIKEIATDRENLLDHIFSPTGALEHLRELSPAEREGFLAYMKEEQKDDTGGRLLTPVSDCDARISPAAAERIFENGSLSPTTLERFSSCQFAYYCRYILKLREEAGDTLSAADVGIFIHYVLENVLRTVKMSGKPFSEYQKRDENLLVAQSVRDFRAHLIESGGGLTPRTEALLNRLKDLAKLVITNLFREFSDSLFFPAFLELDLNAKGEKAALTLEDGTTVPLTGKVDRVDVFSAPDGKKYLRVADYKTSQKSFDKKDIQKGFSLQMPLYLMALCKGKHPRLAAELGFPADTEFLPAGVTYFSATVKKEITPKRLSRQKAMENAVNSLSRNGVFLNDATVLKAMSLSANPAIVGDANSRKKMALSLGKFEKMFEDLSQAVAHISEEMKSGAAGAHPHTVTDNMPCNYCAFYPVCRGAVKNKK